MRKVFVPSLLCGLLILLTAVYMYSCRHETISLNDFPEIKFSSQVLPIFTANCAISGCHNGSGDGEMMNLSSYDGIIKGIVKGKPYSSRIYNSIINEYEGMPPSGPMGIKARSIIKLWIEQGAKNSIDSSSKIADTAIAAGYACYSRDIEPIINSNCAKSNCHSSTTTDNFHLISYYEVADLTTPFQPDNSDLYKIITGADGVIMPPSPDKPLSKTNIDSIYSWIKQGAKNENCASICNTTKFTFAGQVFPIITNYCQGCHSGNFPSGNLNLKDYSSISNIAKSGKLLGVITATGYPQMPPSGKLSDCNITVIEKWVNSGAANNK